MGPPGKESRGGLGGILPPANRAALAGALVGLGFAIKVTIALVGLGLALAVVLRARREPGPTWRRQLGQLGPALAGLAAGFDEIAELGRTPARSVSKARPSRGGSGGSSLPQGGPGGWVPPGEEGPAEPRRTS